MTGAYAQFNFLVDFGAGKPQAAFQEVTKLTGFNKAADVIMKRGVVDSAALDEWLDQVRKGDPEGRRRVTIRLMSEDRTQVVQSWRLEGARIIKPVKRPRKSKGTDLALEELILAYERLEME